MTNLETNEDKLNWIFMAFDQDGGGVIDVNEIRDIVVCLFRSACFHDLENLGRVIKRDRSVNIIITVAVRFTKMDQDQDLLQACVEDIRKIIDIDGDGDISREEFVKNAVNSRFIKNLLCK